MKDPCSTRRGFSNSRVFIPKLRFKLAPPPQPPILFPLTSSEITPLISTAEPSSVLIRISQPYGACPDRRIHITGFTLVRFATRQILERDYSGAWYQLAPHELVDLLASRPQHGVSVAVQQTRLERVFDVWCGKVSVRSGGRRIRCLHFRSLRTWKTTRHLPPPLPSALLLPPPTLAQTIVMLTLPGRVPIPKGRLETLHHELGYRKRNGPSW